MDLENLQVEVQGGADQVAADNMNVEIDAMGKFVIVSYVHTEIFFSDIEDDQRLNELNRTEPYFIISLSSSFYLRTSTNIHLCEQF